LKIKKLVQFQTGEKKQEKSLEEKTKENDSKRFSAFF
jgi:hypothetical protein